MRYDFGGQVQGLDGPGLLVLADYLGYDREALAHLLPYLERGIRTGVAILRRRDKDAPDQEPEDD